MAWRLVTPGYFSALRIPILEGQAFREEDRNSRDRLIILSKSLARRLFPNQDAVNRRLALYPGGPWYTVVGVAGEVKNGGVAQPPDPEYYLVWKHATEPIRVGEASDQAPMGASLILRSPLPPENVSPMIRSSVAQLDPSLPVKNETMEDRVSALEQLPRFNTLLLGFFAALAVGPGGPRALWGGGVSGGAADSGSRGADGARRAIPPGSGPVHRQVSSALISGRRFGSRWVLGLDALPGESSVRRDRP